MDKLRSIGKHSGESVLKKKKKATVGRKFVIYVALRRM